MFVTLYKGFHSYVSVSDKEYPEDESGEQTKFLSFFRGRRHVLKLLDHQINRLACLACLARDFYWH